MKSLRRALAAAIALSLILLSPGQRAWAQAVQIGAMASPSGGASAAAAAASAPGAAGMPGLSIRTLALPSLNPSLMSAPSAMASAAAALAAPAPAAAVALTAPAAPSATVPSAVRAAASVPAAAASAGRLPNGSIGSGTSSPNGSVATAIEGARRELPDFSKMSSGESKGEAAADFMARVGEVFRRVPALTALPAASDGAVRGHLSKSTKKAATQPFEELDGAGNPVKRDGGLDGLGNPVRTGGEHGPDGRTGSDEEGSGGNSSGLFATIAWAGLAAAGGIPTLAVAMTFPLIMISLVLHEIGHAKAAARLGDPTATLQGRASFNPLTWHKHVDPVMTIVLPAITYFTSGFLFGGAKPVPVDQSYFKNPAKDMAKVALAGPAVNVGLAVLGALGYAGAVAMGMSPSVLAALTGLVFINSLLALFNLIPLPPLDGGHILTAFLPRAAGDRVQAFYAKIGMMGMIPIMAVAFLGGGFIMAAAAGLTHLLIGASFAVTGVQMASAALPAIAALGMAIGSMRGTSGVGQLRAHAPFGPAVPGAASSDGAEPVELVVVFSDAKSLTKDLHLSAADPRAADYARSFEGVQRSLLAEVDAVGLTPESLAAYDATPIASYRRINAATFRLDAAKAEEFSAALRAQGHKVFPNRRIIIPAPTIPESADPTVRNAVTMAEDLKITKADAVQAIALKRWGKPDMNPWQKLKRFLGAEAPVQPKYGVVDSGADVSHVQLKRVKEVKNATTGENVDDIGHGSWVTSKVLSFVPWAKNVTHYKTFLNGSATTDDILKALTMAANDGNLVISNSWGDDEGDPQGPDALLVKKLASEGHIMVFAAGNAGPAKNTVGSPAIVQYKDAATGAIRVLAVAAADRNKKIAYFSSRGPASPKTKGQADVPHRPDLTAVGYNTEGAWPAKLGDADRTDPDLGPVKAISGTSMSTPAVAGAISLLLMMFGVTEKGAKLDAVVNAVMATLEKTGQGEDNEGQGFINVEAAYELLYKQFNPGGVPPTAIARYRALRSDHDMITDYLNPLSEANRIAGSPSMGVYSMMLGDLKTIRVAMAALEAEYPGIVHHASGPLARAWARLIGRAPVPAHVAEFRRLLDQVWRDQESLAAYKREINTYSGGVHEEMIEYHEIYVEPKYAAHAAALTALVKAYPNAEYESAGTLDRAWMRLTGRGPK
jgi:Zn-dependent protease